MDLFLSSACEREDNGKRKTTPVFSSDRVGSADVRLQPLKVPSAASQPEAVQSLVILLKSGAQRTTSSGLLCISTSPKMKTTSSGLLCLSTFPKISF